MELYSNVEGIQVPFIHIGGKGTFAVGKNNISNGVTPLQADMDYVVRMVRSKNTVSFRMFPNFKQINVESNFNLETKQGRENLINIIKNNINKSYNDNIRNANENISKFSERKGISVWDFDDTLARTKSNVLYTMPDGT
jgi:L-cysteine desulfidase